MQVVITRQGFCDCCGRECDQETSRVCAWRSIGPGNPGRACGHLMCARCLVARGTNICGCLWNHDNDTEPPGVGSASSSSERPPIEDEALLFVPEDIGELVLASPCKKMKVAPSVDLSIVDDVKQVYNELRGRLHLVCPRVANPGKMDYTVCSKWRCGTAESPSRNAEFYNRFDTIALRASSFTMQFQPCGSCFDMRTLRKHGWADVIPDKDVLLPSVLASDDEVSSASSSDSSLED